MTRAEKLITKNKRMLLIEPVVPFAEIKLSWIVEDKENESTKEVDLFHTYDVNPNDTYIGMQVVKDTALSYELNWDDLDADVAIMAKYPAEFYQLRIPIPTYVKPEDELVFYYGFKRETLEDLQVRQVVNLTKDSLSAVLVGHQGLKTSTTEDDAKKAFADIAEKAFDL